MIPSRGVTCRRRGGAARRCGLGAVVAAVLATHAAGAAAWARQATQRAAQDGENVEGRVGCRVVALNETAGLAWGGAGKSAFGYLDVELHADALAEHASAFLIGADYAWQRLPSTGEVPEPRRSHTLVGPWTLTIDGASQSASVLFGGQLLRNTQYADDSAAVTVVHERDGDAVWTAVPFGGMAPAPRVGHATARLPADGPVEAMYLFGGEQYDLLAPPGNPYVEDMHLLSLNATGNGFVWTPVSFLYSFRMYRAGHSLDAFDDFLLMFGGVRYNMAVHTGSIGSTEYIDETWALRGTNLLRGEGLYWERVAGEAAGPAARVAHTTARVSGTSLVLFGGHAHDVAAPRSIRYFRDAWLFDTASMAWAQLSPAGDVPGIRVGEAFAALFGRSALTMFGGAVMELNPVTNVTFPTLTESGAHLLTL